MKNPHRFKLIERINESLIRAEVCSRTYAWSKNRARKDGICSVSCERYEKGAWVFRPITNDWNRMVRVLESSIA